MLDEHRRIPLAEVQTMFTVILFKLKNENAVHNSEKKYLRSFTNAQQLFKKTITQKQCVSLAL